MLFGIQTRNETKEATISLQNCLVHPEMKIRKVFSVAELFFVMVCLIPCNPSWDPSRGWGAPAPAEHFGLVYSSQWWWMSIVDVTDLWWILDCSSSQVVLHKKATVGLFFFLPVTFCKCSLLLKNLHHVASSFSSGWTVTLRLREKDWTHTSLTVSRVSVCLWHHCLTVISGHTSCNQVLFTGNRPESPCMWKIMVRSSELKTANNDRGCQFSFVHCCFQCACLFRSW